jgi:hypothetical protein
MMKLEVTMHALNQAPLVTEQSLHATLAFTQKLLVIGQVGIFSLSHKTKASRITFDKSFSTEAIRRKSSELTSTSMTATQLNITLRDLEMET